VAEPLRIFVICTIQPLSELLIGRLRELGHEPVAQLAPRRKEQRPIEGVPQLTDQTAPAGIDLLFAKDKHSVAPLLRAYEPDVMLCWGFPWKIPREALDVPRLGSVNQHPGPLPRHRGPIPFAWAFRAGDTHFGLTWHRMDSELDTGNILAQATVPIEDTDTTIFDFAPRTSMVALDLLPRVFERLLAGDPGDPQSEEDASWGGHFEEDYADVDWSQPARTVHNQVRAWAMTFGAYDIVAPVAELDGERVKLLRTSLVDPGGGARRVECGDGPIWVVESESLV
jgi:methionyl-tRNA formyltransferase